MITHRRFQFRDKNVRDELSGAVWSRDADPPGGPLTWHPTFSGVETFNCSAKAGHTDWRMPNIRKIESLVNPTTTPPLSIGHPFINVREGYWSSTTNAYEPCCAWAVYSQDGIVGVTF